MSRDESIELALRRAAGEVAKAGSVNVARWRGQALTDRMWTRGYADGILAAQAIIARLADAEAATTDRSTREDAPHEGLTDAAETATWRGRSA